MPNKGIKKLSYEEALEELESIIEAMEDGSIPLADLVSKFENGAKLLKLCQIKLKEAELKIKKLDIDTETKSTFETN